MTDRVMRVTIHRMLNTLEITALALYVGILIWSYAHGGFMWLLVHALKALCVKLLGLIG